MYCILSVKCYFPNSLMFFPLTHYYFALQSKEENQNSSQCEINDIKHMPRLSHISQCFRFLVEFCNTKTQSNVNQIGNYQPTPLLQCALNHRVSHRTQSCCDQINVFAEVFIAKTRWIRGFFDKSTDFIWCRIYRYAFDNIKSV